MTTAAVLQDKKLNTLAAISGIVSDTPISDVVGLTHETSLNLRVMIEVTGVTVAGSITAKLQAAYPDGTFADFAGANASAAITANGTYSIRQNIEIAADQPNMPLTKMVRVVLTTTNAGDAVTVSKVWFQLAL